MRRKQEQASILPVAEDYFNNMLASVSEMKALIVDLETFIMISVVYTQSKLYKHDVYLVQKIHQHSEKLPHLKAIYFIRPTRDNIDHIKRQLAAPRFKQYYFYFTNELSEQMLNELAQADVDQNRVKGVQQAYMDYYPLSRNVFSLNIPSTIALIDPASKWAQSDRQVLGRCAEGLIALVMSLRLMPQVRFLAGSDACAEISRLVGQKLKRELDTKRSDFLLEERAFVLITQRKEDVVTPLLLPWTYSAMLHQFIGIFNNKVDTKQRQLAMLATKSKETLKEKQTHQFVLSEASDEFFRKNSYSGFGELASNIKAFINQVSLKKNTSFKMDSLQQMQSALSKLPQLNALSATLQKHVSLSCLLSQEIEKGLLFEVSRVEQNLVCEDKRNVEAIWQLLRNQRVDYYLKLKLVLLYSVKHPNDKELVKMTDYLHTLQPRKSAMDMVELLNRYQLSRKSDLFHTRNFKKKAQTYFERIFKDVPNVYTQHKPYLFENVLPDLILDKVKAEDYSYGFRENVGKPANKPIIIIFYLGGATYTEAKEAEAFEDARVIVGGTFIHNSKTFIGELSQMNSEVRSV